ncbi:hypothetical protein B0T11DRAFT_6623 [Plectosphaerella cucumerina]|uniref:Uncharacterized protein n=1 Tax=Plectosphaerella cucumerina TaxID=40658 RepID=A0A8K0X9N8_9PEZI|nr:hypothetical protein B0T11DRAFT_6623 [Plectosphaerella cucumerina]
MRSMCHAGHPRCARRPRPASPYLPCTTDGRPPPHFACSTFPGNQACQALVSQSHPSPRWSQSCDTSLLIPLRRSVGNNKNRTAASYLASGRRQRQNCTNTTRGLSRQRIGSSPTKRQAVAAGRTAAPSCHRSGWLPASDNEPGPCNLMRAPHLRRLICWGLALLHIPTWRMPACPPARTEHPAARARPTDQRSTDHRSSEQNLLTP